MAEDPETKDVSLEESASVENETPAAEGSVETVLSDTEADQEPDTDSSAPFDRIIRMRVPVIVKIAEKKMKVSEVLRLNIGSVIPFDKDAYQHIDLMVNNSTIGLGQPVKIGENFGLKIVEIADISETIKSLGPEKQHQE